MWNKYCDDDFEFKHLDDVYNRMKQKYGTVAIHGDDGVKDSPLEYKENAERLESMKLKLQSNGILLHLNSLVLRAFKRDLSNINCFFRG